jgi:MFS family permease
MATGTKRVDSAGIWRTFSESPLAVKAIFGGVFVNRVGGFLNIFLVLFLTAKGHSPTEASLALGSYGFGGVLGVLIGGMLADRLGARNATVLSMFSSAVLVASLLYLPNYLVLLVAVAIVGLVSQIFRPASATLLSELTPESRQVMIFAMYRFGLNLGTTAAPLLGFALYNLDHHQYTLLFWGEATVALVYGVLALVALPRRSRPAVQPEAQEQGGSRGGYLSVIRDHRYLMFLIATFFNAAVYMQYLSTLPLDVKAEGVPILWYTVAVSVNGLMVIAFELPLTKISQHWPFKVSVGTGFFLLGVGVCFYGLPLGPAVIIIGTLIWTVAEIVGAPAVFAYPAVAGPAHLKGRYIGSFQFMFGLGSAAGPMVGGVLFSQLGHRVWPVLAIGAAISTVLGVAALRTPPKTSTPPQAPVDELAPVADQAGALADDLQSRTASS